MASNGQVVAFGSAADTISPVDNDPYPNVFVRELVTATPTTRADLSVTLTASSTTPPVDSDVTYTVTVTNAGP